MRVNTHNAMSAHGQRCNVGRSNDGYAMPGVMNGQISPPKEGFALEYICLPLKRAPPGGPRGRCTAECPAAFPIRVTGRTARSCSCQSRPP